MGRMEAGCNLQTLAMRHYVSKRGCTQKGVVLIVRTGEDQGGRLWSDVADVKASHPEEKGLGVEHWKRKLFTNQLVIFSL